MYCPNCGAQNRANVNYCESCGAQLQGAAGQPAPQVVYVQSGSRRGRARWLLPVFVFGLLLVSACCCFLLPTGLVSMPAFAAPIVQQLNKVALVERRPVVKQPVVNPPPECGPETERLNAVDTSGIVTCIPELGQCWTELVGLDDYKDVDFYYDWSGGKLNGIATCAPNILNGGKYTCVFPIDKGMDRVDFYLGIGECLQLECWVEGWLEDAIQDENKRGGADGCCPNVDFQNVRYYRDPPEVGQLFLGFDIECFDGWNLMPDTCVNFDAMVGPDRDIFWTLGQCCPDLASDGKLLNCQGSINDQKKSMTLIKLSYGTCEWEFEFQSPYYEPKSDKPDSKGDPSNDCPSGQSMCYGSCCSTGHCCCLSGQGCGCWASCP